VVIDAVRCAKLALNRKIGGALIGPSSYFMKSPPKQFTDNKARELVEAFIIGDHAHRRQPAMPRRRRTVKLVRESKPVEAFRR
jgi:myo-inositol-1-phosphate synthase